MSTTRPPQLPGASSDRPRGGGRVRHGDAAEIGRVLHRAAPRGGLPATRAGRRLVAGLHLAGVVGRRAAVRRYLIARLPAEDASIDKVPDGLMAPEEVNPPTGDVVVRARTVARRPRKRTTAADPGRGRRRLWVPPARVERQPRTSGRYQGRGCPRSVDRRLGRHRRCRRGVRAARWHRRRRRDGGQAVRRRAGRFLGGRASAIGSPGPRRRRSLRSASRSASASASVRPRRARRGCAHIVVEDGVVAQQGGVVVGPAEGDDGVLVGAGAVGVAADAEVVGDGRFPAGAARSARIRAPASMLVAGSCHLSAGMPWAESSAGITCINPWAPATDTVSGSPPDSRRITPAIKERGVPVVAARGLDLRQPAQHLLAAAIEVGGGRRRAAAAGSSGGASSGRLPRTAPLPSSADGCAAGVVVGAGARLRPQGGDDRRRGGVGVGVGPRRRSA